MDGKRKGVPLSQALKEETYVPYEQFCESVPSAQCTLQAEKTVCAKVLRRNITCDAKGTSRTDKTQEC